MDKESLIKVQENVHILVDSTDIPTYEKIELLINLMLYLDPEEYEENNKVLEENRIKKLTKRRK